MFFLLIYPTICLFIIFGLVAALIVDQIRRRRWAKLQYSARPRLLGDGELAFFHGLRSVVPNTLVICPKVSLWDVVQIAEVDEQNYLNDIERLKSTRLDFVLMELTSSRIVMIFELTSSREGDFERKERETVLRSTLEPSGLRCVTVEDPPSFDFLTLGFEAAEDEEQEAA